MTDTAASPATASTVAVNDAVAAAKDLPDLIAKAKVVDPDLAAAITGKALIASKTPWGTLLTTGAAYLSAKYGLGWDESTDELVALGGLVIGSYLMRYVSPARITSLFKKTSATPAT